MKILKQCLKLSKDMLTMPNGRCKHFSFLVQKNRIVSIGWNNGWKSHPLGKKYGHRFSSIHSELHCLLNLKRDLKDLIMVNVRLNKNSKPCEPCQKMLLDYGVTNVFYTTENGWEFIQL